MGTNVHLTPELERFAQECVERGRYNNVSEVVRSGLRMKSPSSTTFTPGDRVRPWVLQAVLRSGMAIRTAMRSVIHPLPGMTWPNVAVIWIRLHLHALMERIANERDESDRTECKKPIGHIQASL